MAYDYEVEALLLVHLQPKSSGTRYNKYRNRRVMYAYLTKFILLAAEERTNRNASEFAESDDDEDPCLEIFLPIAPVSCRNACCLIS